MVLFNKENIVGGKFPNGEKYYKPINAIKLSNYNSFTLIFESVEDLFDLLLYKKYYDDKFLFGYGEVQLIALFMPFGQADRNFPDKIFSFKYVAQLINGAHFSKVKILDPHSRVMEAALDRCRVYNADPSHFQILDYDYYCYPDDGAMKKYSELIEHKYIYGIKKRDLVSGKIIDYKLNASAEEIKGKHILIVDDICMGGRSFKECSKLLNEAGAETVDLYITHLMPQAEEFYKNHKDFGITHFYSENTLNMPWYNNA